ncbi:hypothetical protein Trihar35433_2937 [Trichoderma harzianum]|nr:hypothetical protein Trihar35433_2937 [Trichoderma harzianum]
MAQFTSFLLILLSAFASLIEAQAQGKPSPSPKPPPSCSIKDIRQMDVSKCACEPHHKDTCHKSGCKACFGDSDIQHRFTKSPHCAVGCTDDDKECTGCGLWFSTLCTCLRYDDCNKTASYSNPPPNQAIFVLTNSDEKLVTTTDLLPGILEMANNPSRYEVGWKFAQGNYDRSTHALALNSVRSRTHEQIHIHVCEKPDVNSKEPRIMEILDKIPKKDHNYSKHLTKVAGYDDLYCRTIEAGHPAGDVFYDFLQGIKEVLDDKTLNNKYKICHDYAGAGIIRDSYHNMWACVTGNHDGPLARFCKPSQ